jgi:nucleotide-binding universal stress UspA family protein
MNVMITVGSKIAIPYDDSPLSKKALEKAIVIAQQDENIELNVLTVVEVAFYAGYGINTKDKMREIQHEVVREKLQAVEQQLSKLPNKTKTHVIEGSPAMAILNFVEENDIDLVIMGSRGLSDLKELFLGSVSHNVVQKASCPVFIVK